MGEVDALLADTGDHSCDNLKECDAAGIEPYIPEARQGHKPPLRQRFAEDPLAPSDPGPAEATAHRLPTHAGKARYAKR